VPDELDVGSPEWWLKRLSKQLDDRNKVIRTYRDYYDGKHRLAFATEKFRQAFGPLFEEFADNWCDLVVDAVEERLKPTGFRIGTDAERSDDEAWQIWQRNDLDAESKIAHTEALINRVCYALVWADPNDEKTPSITIESPEQMITEDLPGVRNQRAAALKKWKDDWTGATMATVYLPDGIFKFQTKVKGTQGTSGDRAFGNWFRRVVPDEDWPLENPLELVPVQPIRNRPRLLSEGDSEIRKVIPVQDAINKVVADMLVASEYTAVRQRWAVGLEVPRDPETNEPIANFKTMLDRILISESSDTKFGEFEASDLGNYTKVIEMFVQHVASQSRTPPHYFYLSGQFPSGESIKSAETGLTKKSQSKMVFFGEDWERVIRLGFRVIGSNKADVRDSETIWEDTESRSESEHVDAVTKMAAVGVPWEMIWEDLGFTPKQIEKIKSLPPPPQPQQPSAPAGA
jgi:hypothetical protein